MTEAAKCPHCSDSMRQTHIRVQVDNIPEERTRVYICNGCNEVWIHILPVKDNKGT